MVRFYLHLAKRRNETYKSEASLYAKEHDGQTPLSPGEKHVGLVKAEDKNGLSQIPQSVDWLNLVGFCGTLRGVLWPYSSWRPKNRQWTRMTEGNRLMCSILCGSILITCLWQIKVKLVWSGRRPFDRSHLIKRSGLCRSQDYRRKTLVSDGDNRILNP